MHRRDPQWAAARAAAKEKKPLIDDGFATNFAIKRRHGWCVTIKGAETL